MANVCERFIELPSQAGSSAQVEFSDFCIPGAAPMPQAYLEI
jgi:hypothetical protein